MFKLRFVHICDLNWLFWIILKCFLIWFDFVVEIDLSNTFVFKWMISTKMKIEHKFMSYSSSYFLSERFSSNKNRAKNNFTFCVIFYRAMDFSLKKSNTTTQFSLKQSIFRSNKHIFAHVIRIFFFSFFSPFNFNLLTIYIFINSKWI